jgi:hypothetical protein
MKNSLVAGAILFGVVGLNAQVYTACGDTKEIAKVELAKTIITKVDSSISSQKSNVNGKFDSSTTKKSSQSTNITLSGLKFIEKNGKFCTSISDEKLTRHTDTMVQKALGFSISLLPSEKNEKLKMLKSWISDIDEAIALIGLKGTDTKNTKKLFKIKQSLVDEKQKYINQNLIKFIVNGNVDNMKIEVDGKKVPDSSELVLKRGEYNYTITSSSHCKKTGKIDVVGDDTININMDDYWLPSLIITSNQDRAKLKIDGQSFTLGKKKTFTDCSGKNINYEISFEDKNQKSEFKLSPNNNETRNFDFISKEYSKKMFTKAKGYTEGARIEIKYSFKHISFDKEYEDYENINAGQINYLQYNNWFRYGYGIEYGDTEYSKVREAYFMLALQIPTADESALHIGKVVFIPYIGGKIGVGEHKLYDTETEIVKDKFPSDDIVVEDEGDEFQRDHVMGSVVGGFDIAVTKYIGINFFVEKTLTQEKSMSYGLGLSLKL